MSGDSRVRVLTHAISVSPGATVGWEAREETKSPDKKHIDEEDNKRSRGTGRGRGW